MILQIRKLASLAGLAFSALCASVRCLPYEKGVGVVDILRNVRYELATAYSGNPERHPRLRHWAAGVELTLDVTEARNGGATTQILVPIHMTDSFRLGADFHRRAKELRVSSVTFSTALASLNQTERAQYAPARSQSRRRDRHRSAPAARPGAQVPQQTQQDLSNIVRSLKQIQIGRD